MCVSCRKWIKNIMVSVELVWMNCQNHTFRNWASAKLKFHCQTLTILRNFLQSKGQSGKSNVQLTKCVTSLQGQTLLLFCLTESQSVSLSLSKIWTTPVSLPCSPSDLLYLLYCRARGLATSSSGMFAVRWQGVHTSANAWLWFWRPTSWVVARQWLTASPSRSRLWRPYRRLPWWLKTSTLTRPTFPLQVEYL